MGYITDKDMDLMEIVKTIGMTGYFSLTVVG